MEFRSEARQADVHVSVETSRVAHLSRTVGDDTRRVGRALGLGERDFDVAPSSAFSALPVGK